MRRKTALIWGMAAAISGLLLLSSFVVSAAPMGDTTPTPQPYDPECDNQGYLVTKEFSFSTFLTGKSFFDSINYDDFVKVGQSPVKEFCVYITHAWTGTWGNASKTHVWLDSDGNIAEIYVGGDANTPGGGARTVAKCWTSFPPFYRNGHLQINYHVQDDDWNGGGDITSTLQGHITYCSSEPIEPCADVSDMTPSSSGSIDATNENGVSETLTPGTEYVLVISGGPWHDAPDGIDRYDIVFSFDGVDWQPLATMASDPNACLYTEDGKTTQVTFVAQTDTLTLRVNDIPGQFSDNDGAMDYSLYENGGGGSSYCANFFQNETWFASGAIPASSDAGGRFPPDSGFGEPLYFTPGQWYKLEMAHPWQEGDGSDQLGVQIMDPVDGVWVDMADWAYTVCADDTGVVYFRPPKSEYYIRADDQDGNFANNSNLVAYNLYTAEYRPPPNPCEGLYDIQNWIDSAVIPASDSNGSPVPSEGSGERLRGGYYYFLEQTGPQWTDGGVPTWGLQISDDLGQTWYDADKWPMAVCVSHDDQGRYKIFFQANTTQIWVRAADYNGYWADNSGNVSYNLYFAGDNAVPPEGSCSSEFSLIEDPNVGDAVPVEEGSVPANAANGQSIGANLVPGSWYAIDASLDYWFDDSFPRSEADLGDGVNWYLLQNWPGAACAEQIDNLYVRMWFRYNGESLSLRAHDPLENWGDNSGNVTYRIYPAYHRESPPPSACWASYNIQLVEHGVLYANLENGQELTSIVGDGETVYALETTDPPWTEGDGTSYYQIDISDDGGETWYPLEMAPFAECIASLDGHNYRIYWTPPRGKTYLIRVADKDGNFGNNSGGIGYNVFSADTTTPPGQTGAACDQLFTNPQLVATGSIPANAENGKTLNLVPGYYYRIDTSGPAWLNGGVESWDVALSKDDGANWEALVTDGGTLSQCTYRPDGVHWRAYIQVTDGDVWRMRAHDPGGYYADNEGEVQYAIYRVNYQEPVDIPPPPPLEVGCNAVCIQPDSALNVPAWLEYGWCRFIKFISWCPYHRAALEGIVESFFSREPFVTISQIRDVIAQVKSKVESIQYSQDEEPFGGMSSDEFLTAPDSDSPWQGGQIQILGPSGGYNLACQNALTDAVGQRLAQAICFSLSLARNLGILGWFQVLVDVLAVMIGVLYLWNVWISPQFGSG